MRNLFIAIIAIAAVLVGYHQVRSMDQSNDKEMSALPENARTAVFAGGCFWCTESDFEKADGVIDAISGYTGGKEVNPTYKQVSAGRTGHVEAVKVVYDPAKITYAELLDVFWRNIDPTTPNRQFCDVGAQYRPEIFYHDEEQRRLADALRAGQDRRRAAHPGGVPGRRRRAAPACLLGGRRRCE